MAVVPSFFNAFSASMFEPDKAAVVRTLAAVGGGVGIIGLAARLWRQRGAGLVTAMRSPVVLAAVVYLCWLFFASLFSIDPPRSLLGTVQRGRGWITMAAEFAVFAGVVAGMRRRVQFERLIAAIVIGSFPVALLAVLQHFGVETVLGGATAFGGRPPSFLGNPIFVGSYLCTVAPLAVWLTWLRLRRQEWLLVLLLGLHLLMLFAALILTGSRGPLLACGTSFAAGGVVMLLTLGYRRAGTWLSLIGLLAVGLVAGVMLQRVSPDALVRGADENSSARMSTVQVRLWVYRAVSARMRDHDPIAIRDARDRFASVRWLTGYGPQCLAMAVDKHFPPELEAMENEGTVIDAAHNRLLEVWAEAGLPGVVFYAGLIAALLLVAVRSLGWAIGRGGKRLLFGSLLVGSGLTAAAFAIWWGWFAWALGALVGLGMGLPLYFLLAAAHEEPVSCSGALRGRRIAGVAVAAALLAAVVDGQFGVQTVSVGLLFWCLAGVVVAIPRIRWQEGPSESQSGFDAPTAYVALTLGLVLVSSLMLPAANSDGWRAAITKSIFGMPVLFGGTSVAFGLLLALKGMRFRSLLQLLGWAVGGAVVLFLTVTCNSVILEGVTNAEMGTVGGATQYARGLIRISLLRIAMPALACMLLALLWPWGESRKQRWLVRGVWLAGAAALLPGAAVIVMQVLGPEVKLAVADQYRQQGGVSIAVELCGAAATGPMAGHALSEQHLIYGNMALQQQRPELRERYFTQARETVERAIALEPFDARHYDRLGGVLQVAAAHNGGSRRMALAEAAIRAFGESLQLAPGRTSVRLKQTRIASGLLKDLEKGRKILLEARKVDTSNPKLAEELARVSFELAKRTTDPAMRRSLLQQAAENARFALDMPRVGNVDAVNVKDMRRVLDIHQDFNGAELAPVSAPVAAGVVLSPHLGMGPLAFLQWIVALGLAMLLTPTVRCLAPRLGMIDLPAHRKAHTTPTPLMGGAAIYLALTVSGLLAWPAWVLSMRVLMLAATLLFIVGVCDDRWGMAWQWKMGVQIVVAITLYMVGLRVQLAWLPTWVNVGLTMVWLVGITNGVNFLDNMDGLAAGVGAIAALAFSVMGAIHGCWDVAGVSAALAGACLGFLRFNGWHATIFMGDAGSLVLGILLAALGLAIRFPEGQNWVTWMVPILVMGVPVLDTSLVVVSRLRRGVNPFATPGKDHVSHRLVRAGLSKSMAVTFVWLGSLCCAAMGLAVTMLPPPAAYGVGIVYIGIYFVLIVTFELRLPYREPAKPQGTRNTDTQKHCADESAGNDC